VTSRLVAMTSALALACILVVHLDAADGILLVQRTTSGTSTQTAQVQIEKTRMRTEVADPRGAMQVVIFDGTKQVLILVDVTKKTYTEVTKAQLDQISAQMQGMMAQMQAQMASMPPEARAQVEAAMQGRGMAAMGAPPKIEYRRNGTDTVGRWTCNKYDGYQNGQKTSEICTVEPAALGFGAADFEVTRQLASFFAALVPQMAGQVMAVGKAEEQGFSGFPIKSVMTVAGNTITTELTEASRQTFPESIFAAPAGFTKQDFMGGRGRGGM
jgi:hypothetical protein